MESETIIAPPVTKPFFLPKQSPKLLYLFGGVAVILFSIALAIVFFGNQPGTQKNSSTNSSQTDSTAKDFSYQNANHFYALQIPLKWQVIDTSPDQSATVIIQTDELAIFTINSFPAPSGNIDEYLASLADRKILKSNAVRVGAYDAVERFESWVNTSLQPVITYLQIQDKIYVFSLLPTNNQNAIVSENILRSYRYVLSTFNLTSTQNLGKDWKQFQTSKVDQLNYPTFTISHPQSWVAKEYYENKNLIISIYRNNYEIKITQAEIGNAICLFKDSPAFQGSSGDLRNKDFIELSTTTNLTFRRYFNQNQGDKSTFFFCQRDQASSYFTTPTQIGGIAYYVPAKFDENIVKEMDKIIETISPTNPSPSPSPQ